MSPSTSSAGRDFSPKAAIRPVTLGLATNASGSEERLWRVTFAPWCWAQRRSSRMSMSFWSTDGPQTPDLAAHRRLEQLDAALAADGFLG